MITPFEAQKLIDYRYNLRAILEETINKNVKAKIKAEMESIRVLLDKTHRQAYHKNYRQKCFQYVVKNICPR